MRRGSNCIILYHFYYYYYIDDEQMGIPASEARVRDRIVSENTENNNKKIVIIIVYEIIYSEAL